MFTDPGDVVIDPVAGSGTTLRAAYELGRSAYGFEVDKSFYEAAREKMLAPILRRKRQSDDRGGRAVRAARPCRLKRDLFPAVPERISVAVEGPQWAGIPAVS